MLKRTSIKLPSDDKLKSALVSTTGTLFYTRKSPDEALGELFADVQKSQVYADGKTFVDLIPKGRVKAIQKEYLLAKEDPSFDLRDFVSRHFYEFEASKPGEYKANPDHTISQHISELWRVLERRNRLNRGSLLALPNPYIVPGGRFSEQFYWDSYFIMLGLAADNQWSMIEGMMKNCTFMLRKYGFIPTANRTYFLSRSQPPFFSQMIKLLASHNGKRRTYAEYLPYMLIEYRFWMKGRTKLAKMDHGAFARVVQMPNGMYLNRYYDNKTTPRPESLREDIETADSAKREADRLFLHLRAGAESGWDFSSRWFIDRGDITTIHTADIIPVDLNCLLYQLESLIAETYRLLKNPLLARKFQTLADHRERAIMTYCWSDQEDFFVDYNFHHQEPTGKVSLAGVFPLYAGIATKRQADIVAAKLEKDFLQAGGLVTTLAKSGQQWDSPNGWAPLQWIAIQGLRRYGHYQLADKIKSQWIKLNSDVYVRSHKLIEKYNVVDSDGLGGGGEYPLQDGFGWTNGVLASLLAEEK
jgi:alpha,alpha-trehalase